MTLLLRHMSVWGITDYCCDAPSVVYNSDMEHAALYDNRMGFHLLSHGRCGSNLQLIFNTLRPRQNGRRFPDDIFKYIFLNENVWISLKISLKFIPKVRINNIPLLVQIMAWRRPGDKPLSEPMLVSLPTHICVTRPQWVKLISRVYILRISSETVLGRMTRSVLIMWPNALIKVII